MPDPETALALQALLYARGALEGSDAARFEARLGEDQEARDALARAVSLARGRLDGDPPRPDPAYRDRVRRHVAKLSRQNSDIAKNR